MTATHSEAPAPSATPATATPLPVDLGAGPFAVTTSGLTKRYERTTALDRLDLQVPERAVYVLVGPNGAGKTTLLRVLMGLVQRDAGVVQLLGVDPNERGGEARALVGYVPEGHDVGYPWMRVGRLLAHHRRYHPTWDDAYARRLAEVYELDPARRCGALSKGQRRRIQLLLALAPRPPLLLLDEPTDGLDHVVRDATLTLLTEHLSDSPTTVLVSTHRVYEVERLVDHVGVLSHGRLLGQLPHDELRGKLRRYEADVPEGWRPALIGVHHVLRRADRVRQIDWTVWGEEERVVAELSRAGATVRDVSTLSTDEAATALLSRTEEGS